MAEKITKIAIQTALAILAIAAIWYAFRIPSFNSLSEPKAERWLLVSEVLLIVSAIALVFGLLGEWPDSESWKKRFAYKAAKSFVIIGVVGELLGDAGIFAASGRLQRLQDIAVTIATDRATDAGFDAALANNSAAQANERTAQLEKEVTKARATIAEANARAAEATQKAEEEKTARLELENKLSPRQLMGDRRARFVQDMLRFSGTALDIVVYPNGTSDIGPIQNAITLALREAGWTVRRWNMMGTEYVVGIGVAVRPDATPEARSIADSLVAELNSADLLSTRLPDLPDNTSFPMPAVGPAPQGQIAAIRMYVGTKPM